MADIEELFFNQTLYGGFFIIRTINENSKFSYKTAIEFIKSWCEENCDGWFIVSTINDDSRYVEVAFECEEDFAAFKLRWL